MFYIRTNFHMPSPDILLAVTIKLKAECRTDTISILLFRVL
jgi:hypothetical protein